MSSRLWPPRPALRLAIVYAAGFLCGAALFLHVFIVAQTAYIIP